jgi:hypothetical protein
MAVTRKQAEQVLAAIKKRYAGLLETDPELPSLRPWPPPKLIENWDFLDSGPTPWAIVWEEGPDEWAYRAAMGGLDEEVCHLAADEIGRSKVARKVRDEGFAMEEPLQVLKNVHLEPVTTWALGIYEG